MEWHLKGKPLKIKQFSYKEEGEHFAWHSTKTFFMPNKNHPLEEKV